MRTSNYRTVEAFVLRRKAPWRCSWWQAAVLALAGVVGVIGGLAAVWVIVELTTR